MIDLLAERLKPVAPHLKLNSAREYLQWTLLQGIDDAGCWANLAFTGGTALRVVFGNKRFSEDLDFSLVKREGYDTGDLCRALLQRLERLSLKAGASDVKDRKAVGSFFIRISNLLHPLGIAREKGQKLSIKIEVDKNPPAGGRVEEYLFQDPILFYVNHYDLPSLFATKLHAFLFRGYDKGRDYYDLLFLLGRKARPNLSVFRNAVRHTHPRAGLVTEASPSAA